MKDKLIAMLKALGLYAEEKKAEIEKALDELKIDEPKPASTGSASTNSSMPTKEVMEQLAALAEQNKQLFAALAEEKKAREASQKTIAEQMRKDRETKIAATIEEAKKAGKITPAQEAHYKKLLESDFDTTAQIINALPVHPAAKPEQKQDDKGKPTIPAAATLSNAGLPAIREQIAKLTTISDN